MSPMSMTITTNLYDTEPEIEQSQHHFWAYFMDIFMKLYILNK